MEREDHRNLYQLGIEKREGVYFFPPGVYGLVGDLHVGSPFFDMENFSKFVDMLEKRGSKIVISTGDVFESNDLFCGRISESDFMKSVKRFKDLLDENGIRIFSIFGNHDEKLKSKFPSLFIDMKGGIIFVEDKLAPISIGNCRFLLTHDASGIDESLIDDNEIILSGHSHIPKISPRSLNPGGFRKHFKENLPIGGLIVEVDDEGNLLLSRSGDFSAEEEFYLRRLKELGFKQKIAILDSSLPETALFREILKQLRKIDPQCALWVTGSMARGNMNKNRGLLNIKYQIVEEDGGFLIIPTPPEKFFIGEVSDLDIEAISSLLTREEAEGIIKRVISSSFYDTPRRIEFCCYHPRDVRRWLNLLSNKEDNYFNYFLYRFLLSPIGVVNGDNESKEELEYLIRVALNLMVSGGEEIFDSHVRVAGGYLEVFKPIKQEMRMEYCNGNPFQLPRSSLGHFYLSQSRRGGKFSNPPYRDTRNPSFKLVMPDYDAPKPLIDIEEGGIEEGKNGRLIVSPPISVYGPDIHLGQVLNIVVSSTFARIFNMEYNPFNFQVTGPFWKRKGFTKREEILTVAERNLRAISEIIRNFGFFPREIRRDDDEKNKIFFENLLTIWENLGLILKEEAGGRDLRLGAVSILFGLLKLVEGLSPQLRDALSIYEDNKKTIPIYPLGSKGDAEYFVRLSEGNMPVYPTFLAASLPYSGISSKPEAVLTVTGENIATQFGILSIAIAQTFNPHSNMIAPYKLILSSGGKRMTRREGNIPYFSDLKEIVESSLNSMPLDEKYKEILKYLLMMYGLLSFSKFYDDPPYKFNQENFIEGINVFMKIRQIIMSLGINIERDLFFEKIYDNSYVEHIRIFLSEKIKKSSSFSFRNFINEFRDKINFLNKFENLNLENEDLRKTLTLGYLLFGDLFLDFITTHNKQSES